MDKQEELLQLILELAAFTLDRNKFQEFQEMIRFTKEKWDAEDE